MVTNNASFQLFRLRSGTQIHGYMKFFLPSKPTFSRDKMWWTADTIEYSEKDTYVELNDINQQWIFERDIVEMKPIHNRSDVFNATILFDETQCGFTAIRNDTFSPIHVPEWSDYRFKIISYLFINNDLQHVLTEKGWPSQ